MTRKTQPRLARQKTRQLDDELAAANIPSRPRSGWIAAVRQALGMSKTQLAARMDIVRQSLDNLESNELKGTITLALEDAGDGGVHMRVSDTGKGLPSRDGNKIFEPGYTTKKRGWGMGLALVKRIVTQYHGGRIRVESSSSHGTTFLVTLPPAPAGKPAS